MENILENKLRIVKSNSFNPWYNLSLEEHLLDTVKEDEIVLYLWQNDNTVVIGRNQNAWKECAWQQLESDGGSLARRLSGGGAVYHDLGNLNFTFVMNTKHYDIHRHHSVIIDALSKFGIVAEFSGRNDMLIDGKKFSGHAYYTNNKKSYHHGTLMVSSDLDKLGYYLRPSEKKIKSKGVDSVRSRVANISDYNGEVTISKLQDSMEESFIRIYGGSFTHETYDKVKTPLKALYDKYSSWEWKFGKSPSFDVSYTERFPWGEVELCFSLKNGEIVETRIYTDAMDTEIFSGLSDSLKSCRFEKQVIIDAVLKSVKDEAARNDMAEWLRAQI
jgi:lipoate-protein ligase A